jgi:hypothetical protein
MKRILVPVREGNQTSDEYEVIENPPMSKIPDILDVLLVQAHMVLIDMITEGRTIARSFNSTLDENSTNEYEILMLQHYRETERQRSAFIRCRNYKSYLKNQLEIINSKVKGNVVPLSVFTDTTNGHGNMRHQHDDSKLLFNRGNLFSFESTKKRILTRLQTEKRSPTVLPDEYREGVNDLIEDINDIQNVIANAYKRSKLYTESIPEPLIDQAVSNFIEQYELVPVPDQLRL